MAALLKKIGIYGGTFDPIHHGHLILAREALEQLELEQIDLCAGRLSPHKLGQGRTPSARCGWRCCSAAIEDEPRFRIDEIELHRPPPSYTIDTVELRRRDNQRGVLLSSSVTDNLPQLETWHRFDELRELVQFVVLERGDAAAERAYPVIRRQIDISATEIRNRVATGHSIRYLVPPAVEEIIRRRQLYQEPNK